MKIAIDTSVILDVITDDRVYARSSEAAIRDAMAKGQILIGECVLAEIAPALPGDSLLHFLSDWNIVYHPSGQESAMEAGRMFELYLKRKGPERRVLPDFLIGAHAMCYADRLLARDRGYFRDYFKALKLIVP